MTIGEKIKTLRINQNLTQEEVADYAKTTKQTIHKYETGIISNIPASKIKLISERLHTTPSYLMGWDDNSPEAEASEDERFNKLWSMYSSLSQEDRDAADKYLAFLLENYPKE